MMGALSLWLRNAGHAARQDTVNWLRHGRPAPRFAQLVWVATDRVRARLNLPGLHSGEVWGGDWDEAARPLSPDEWEMTVGRQRWLEGLSWEETGAVRRLCEQVERLGVKDGCQSVDDVLARYAAMDALFEQVRENRRLATQRELSWLNFREYDGILIHVNRRGEPVFGRRGCHRLAMARLLELPLIPAQVGVVHEQAMPDWQKGLR